MTAGPEAPGLHINELFINNYATTRTGRPVAERTAYQPLKDLQQSRGVPIGDIPTLNYDSRIGTLMNFNALEALGDGQKQQLRDSFAWLREKYFAYIKQPPTRLSDHQLFDIAYTGAALPNYLILRTNNPLDRHALPDVVGNLHIASLGFRNVAGHGVDNDHPRYFKNGKGIYGYANANKLFYHGQRDMKRFTCAASAELIATIGDTLLFGSGADPQRSQLPSFISDSEFGNVFRFGYYNLHYQNAIFEYKQKAISHKDFLEKMVELQLGINLELGRDTENLPLLSSNDFDPVTRLIARFTYPQGGPVATAQAEIEKDLQALQPEKHMPVQSGVVYVRHQRTTGKNRKGKKGRG